MKRKLFCALNLMLCTALALCLVSVNAQDVRAGGVRYTDGDK